MRALVVALVAVLPAAARADDQELARAHFVTGGSYYEQARYGEALHEFEEAYRLSKRVGFLYNIGVCHEQLGHTSAAISAFEGYLGAVNEPNERADLKARIDRLRATQSTSAAAASSGSGALQLTATGPPAKRPVWKRGWFVGVMVGAAALVVAGVTVGVVLGTASQGPRTIMDVTLR
jgi:tetratricopeptide (TPR) repeat protein